MLVYFDPAAMCDHQPELVLAPLPASKQLWEAGDEFAWKVESDRANGIQNAFGLATSGELVELDESQLFCREPVLLYEPLETEFRSKMATNWEEWCSGMDGLGGLIMLAASLIG